MDCRRCLAGLCAPIVAGALLCLAAIAAKADAPPPLFPSGPPPAKRLDVVNLVGADLDTKLAATTLQGLLNQNADAPVYLLLFDPNAYPLVFWLDQMKDRGYIDGADSLDAGSYFEKYLDRASGLVVYDPDLPATMNIATMIAGIERRVVVSPAMAEQFKPRLPDILDLRGRWHGNAEAYTWAFQTLWPQMRHDILAVLHPTHAQHHLRDYLVQQRIFTFWVTGQGKDGVPGADHEAEKAVAQRVLAAAPPNTPVIGWWDGGEKDPGLTEYGGVGWAGQYGKLTFAMNWQANLSLLAGVPVDKPALLARFSKRTEALANVEARPDKVYLSFVIMESGDSPTYWEHVQKRVWDDPKRGSLPIGWTITPALLDALPHVAEWYLDHATPQDHFVAALSGWGYCHPYRGFMSQAANPEVSWETFLSTTSAHMERLGLVDLALYTDAWRPFDRGNSDAITERFEKGVPGLRTLILGMGRDEGITTTTPHYRMGSTVVSHVFTRWDASNVGRNEANNRWLAEEIRRNTPENRPAFMFVHPLSWSYYPSDLAEVQRDLGDGYVVVSPGALSRMIAQSIDSGA